MTAVSGIGDEGQEWSTARAAACCLTPSPHPGISSIHSPGRERRVRTRGEEPWTAGEAGLAVSPRQARWEGDVLLLVTDP